MKKMISKFRETLQSYWSRTMSRSDNVKMSRGAQYVDKIITFARGDNWRRRDTKKESDKK